MYVLALVLDNVVQHIGTYDITPKFSSPLLIVDITDYEGEVDDGYVYNPENGTFTESEMPTPEPEPEPEPEQIPTLDDKIDDLKSQVESDNLVTFEVLATMYEESGNNIMTSFEVMAEMYEEILLLREQVDQLTGGVPQ